MRIYSNGVLKTRTLAGGKNTYIYESPMSSKNNISAISYLAMPGLSNLLEKKA